MQAKQYPLEQVYRSSVYLICNKLMNPWPMGSSFSRIQSWDILNIFVGRGQLLDAFLMGLAYSLTYFNMVLK